MLQDFTREVLRSQPENINEFAAKCARRWFGRALALTLTLFAGDQARILAFARSNGWPEFAGTSNVWLADFR